MLVEARDMGDGVRMLVLNRPPANAIDRDFNRALAEQCDAAREDASVRAVIVAGNGKFFSGGVDLRAGERGEMVGNLGGGPADGVFALWTMPKPTIAMVNGHAIAGGMIIVLACDFRITCQGRHKFGLNEVSIGLGFPQGAFEIARMALAPRALRDAALGAELFEAPRALELGIVDEVVAPERLEERCVAIGRRLAAHGQLAYAHTKRAIQREAVARVMTQRRGDLLEVAEVVGSDETRSLLAAQLANLGKK
jgi:enoyl-CoA hydratase/carnithine racemase